MKKLTIALAATASTALIAGPAAAAVTFDPATGKGFVGKGDVQLAMGWNNAQLQSKAGTLAFTTSQPASQALSSSAEQSATQSATQGVTRTVSCTIEQKTKTFTNAGSRQGEATGTRSGSRAGSRAGTLSGALSSVVDYDARVKNQVNGFKLTGYKVDGAPTFGAVGVSVWGDPTFEGGFSFGNYTFGEVEWSGWQAEPGENPADCLGNNPGITNLSDTTRYGDVVEGDVTEGAITYGDTKAGAVSATGPAVVSVNGRAMN